MLVVSESVQEHLLLNIKVIYLPQRDKDMPLDREESGRSDPLANVSLLRESGETPLG